jgi:hypothetical protein
MIADAIQLLSIMTPVGGGLWAFYLYIDQKRERNKADAFNSAHEAETRRFESRRPFLELKLKTYIEISQIVGELVSERIASTNWAEAEKRFWSFYWSQLSMVESQEIEDVMVELGKCVERCRASTNEDDKHDLRDNSYDLAHQIRREIESDWQSSVVNGEKDSARGTT